MASPNDGAAHRPQGQEHQTDDQNHDPDDPEDLDFQRARRGNARMPARLAVLRAGISPESPRGRTVEGTRPPRSCNQRMPSCPTNLRVARCPKSRGNRSRRSERRRKPSQPPLNPALKPWRTGTRSASRNTPVRHRSSALTGSAPIWGDRRPAGSANESPWTRRATGDARDPCSATPHALGTVQVRGRSPETVEQPAI